MLLRRIDLLQARNKSYAIQRTPPNTACSRPAQLPKLSIRCDGWRSCWWRAADAWPLGGYFATVGKRANVMPNLIAVVFFIQFAANFFPYVYRRLYYLLQIIALVVFLIIVLIRAQMELIGELCLVLSALFWADIVAWPVIQYRAGPISLSFKQTHSVFLILAGTVALLVGIFQFGLAFGQNISGNTPLVVQSFLTFDLGLGLFSLGAYGIAQGLFRHCFRSRGLTVFSLGLIDWTLIESHDVPG